MSDGHIRQPFTWHGYVWSFLTRSSTLQARKKERGWGKGMCKERGQCGPCGVSTQRTQSKEWACASSSKKLRLTSVLSLKVKAMTGLHSELDVVPSGP
jgi:hypothetical protein